MNSCPLCGRPETPLYFIRKDMRVHRCPACSMMFQSEDSQAAKNRELIDGIYEEYLRDGASHKLLNARRVARMEELTGGLAGKKVLEIGTGPGVLAQFLLQAGAEYRGLEPSPLCFSHMEKHLPALKGLVENSYYAPGMFPPESFDILVMTDTLEHIAGPLTFLRGVLPAVKAGGLVYLEVPSETFIRPKGLLRSAFGLYNGYPTNPEHANLFTKRTLNRFINEAGLEPGYMSQMSVWGDLDRVTIALNGRVPAWVWAACMFFRFTKLDILLEQGVLTACARKTK